MKCYLIWNFSIKILNISAFLTFTHKNYLWSNLLLTQYFLQKMVFTPKTEFKRLEFTSQPYCHLSKSKICLFSLVGLATENMTMVSVFAQQMQNFDSVLSSLSLPKVIAVFFNRNKISSISFMIFSFLLNLEA